MIVWLPDTNTVSHLLRGNPQVQQRFREGIAAGDELILSAIVDYEVYRGLLRKGATALLVRYESAAASFHYRELDRSVWRRAAELWAHSRHRAMPLPDADILIAAHAIETGATLASDNLRHFELFQPLGLQLENWIDR
ncbi:MAG TPA: PIN domain-containing protein [Armatimonadota bacterium]|nr:PIN domain-containing protein [Armatimonadota bacterium]